jgi:putative ABC transport system ATP-binding protein
MTTTATTSTTSPAPNPLQDRAAQPVVSLRRVSRTYGEGSGTVAALDDVTLDIRRGDFTAVMGPSGSGKSTLMNVAAGLDDVTGGDVVLGGATLSQLDDDGRTKLRRSQVGFVFQAFNLVPTLSVHENIRLPFELSGRRVGATEEQWIGHLVHTLGLTDRVSHRPSELSGGQQQRVAIARALASRPAVIFADEPTGNLDSRSSREVLTLLRTAAREYGQTIVMVSHDPVAASYADRILIIADGRLVADHGALSPQRISELLIGLEVGAP